MVVRGNNIVIRLLSLKCFITLQSASLQLQFLLQSSRLMITLKTLSLVPSCTLRIPIYYLTKTYQEQFFLYVPTLAK